MKGEKQSSKLQSFIAIQMEADRNWILHKLANQSNRNAKLAPNARKFVAAASIGRLGEWLIS